MGLSPDPETDLIHSSRAQNVLGQQLLFVFYKRIPRAATASGSRCSGHDRFSVGPGWDGDDRQEPPTSPCPHPPAQLAGAVSRASPSAAALRVSTAVSVRHTRLPAALQSCPDPSYLFSMPLPK